MSLSDFRKPLVLILDVGTSSLRAQIRDGEASAISDLDVRLPHRVLRSSDGRATLDADEILDGVASAVDQILERAGSLTQQVGGVAAATLVSNVLGVDSQGRPLTPIYTYADTRSRADTEELRREVDGQDVHDRTGCLLHSKLPTCTLSLAESDPAGSSEQGSLLDLDRRIPLLAFLPKPWRQSLGCFLEWPAQPPHAELGQRVDLKSSHRSLSILRPRRHQPAVGWTGGPVGPTMAVAG